MAKNLVFFRISFPKIDPDKPGTIEAEIQARHDGTFHRMTPLITEPELDGYIDQMIQELEAIRKEGKLKFAQAKRKMLKR